MEVLYTMDNKIHIKDSNITFDKYQDTVRETAFYPNIGKNLSYPALGLAEEAGEVCGKIKKIIRDDGGILSQEKKEEIVKELGDILFYISAQCWELDIKLSDVANKNIEKIRDRFNRGKLKGSGDNR